MPIWIRLYGEFMEWHLPDSTRFQAIRSRESRRAPAATPKGSERRAERRFTSKEKCLA